MSNSLKNIKTLILFFITIGGSFWIANSPLIEMVIKNPELINLGRTYLRGILLVVSITITVSYYLRITSQEVLNKINRLAPPIFYVSFLFFIFSLSTLTILKINAFHYYADMANNLEILWRETHGLGLTTPMFGERHHGLHWFAAHFTPIAYLIAYPWFHWFPYPQTLCILEILALASAVIPITLYARERLEPKIGYWIGVLYLLYPTIHYTALYDFGFLQFCIPFLAWAFYFLYKRRLIAYSLFIFLALLCREEVGFTIFLLGLYVLFIKKDRWVGISTATIGIGYSILALKVIIPSFRIDPGLIYMGFYEKLGGSVTEIIQNLALHPWKILPYFFGPIPLGNLVLFFLPLLFLPFGTPSILLISSANFITSFLTGGYTHSSFMLYYLSPALPFFFFAATETIKRLTSRQNKVGFCLFVSALSCLILFGPSPLSVSFFIKDYQLGNFYSTNFHYSRLKNTEHYRLAREVIKLVPEKAIIAAEQPYLPYLYNRQEIRVFPCVDQKVNYVLIDKKLPIKTGCEGENYHGFREKPELYYEKIENDPSWKLVKESDEIYLFERSSS